MNQTKRTRSQSPEAAIRVVDDLSVGTREDLGRVHRFVERAPAALPTNAADARLELVVGHPSPAGLGRRLADGLQAIFDAPVQVGWSDRLSLQFKGVMAVVGSAQVPEEGQHR